ncbi:MAG TPA: LD-carboxypeptidase [Alphaproteobacteria bacterium]|nr:LD-carboxypeptidase [Alphaproteobacteria bacterium]
MLDNLIIPKKLEKGDNVAIVASSWGGPASFPQKFNYGVKQLEENFGVKCIVMPFATASAEEVYNSPQKRAEDLMAAFKNPEIKAIISAIGGDDSIRMLPYIDFEVIRNNPKIYIGYSDSTISHFMCLKAGVRSYYGPSMMAGFAENGGLIPFMKKSVEKTLFSNDVIGLVDNNNDGYIIKQHNWNDELLLDCTRDLKLALPTKIIHGSKNAKGRLIGGCVEVLEFMKGTDLFPKSVDFKDAILFFETSEDNPEACFIKWWFRNYAASGILANLAGIIIGRPGDDDPKYVEKQYQAVIDVLKEEGLDIPVLVNANFGHTDPQMVVPYGAMAEIDIKTETFSILESGTK